MERLSSGKGRILLLPEGVSGGPKTGMIGLEGLLANRVKTGKVIRGKLAAGAYELRVATAPGTDPMVVGSATTLHLQTGWTAGPRTLRVHFWRARVPQRRYLDYQVWMARLGEVLSFEDPGGQKRIIVDCDGDGFFCTYSKDLLVEDEKDSTLPPLPLTKNLLYATGGFAFNIDGFDRITLQRIKSLMGLLHLEFAYSGLIELEQLVVCAGETYRAVPKGVTTVPVIPGRWRPYWGRIEGGLLFTLHGDRLREANGVRVKQGKEGSLRLGAPFELRSNVNDGGRQIHLEGLRIFGASGEEYFPDQGRSANCRPVHVLAHVVEGGRQGKSRVRVKWVPWTLDSMCKLHSRDLKFKVSPHWDPLILELTITSGPLKGAGSRTRIR